jgi:hypothetical protein
MEPRIGRRRGPIAAALALGAFLCASGCGGGKSGGSSGSANPPGSVVQHTDGSGEYFVVEQNGGGSSNPFRIVNLAWGRLVDIFDQDAGGLITRRFRDYPIGRDIVSDGVDFLFERNALTGAQNLIILHPFGSPQFQSAFSRLEQNLQPVTDLGLAGGFPLTMVARNSVLVIRFNDLVAAETVNRNNIKLLVGNPPIVPQESRLVVDRTHGDAFDRNGDGVAEFYSTRVLVDFTISPTERAASAEPLDVNNIGLPEGLARDQVNAVIRIPTLINLDAGQFSIFRSLGQRALAFSGNGSTDPNSPTLDIVRAFRSGGSNLNPPDPFNGFLPDSDRPIIVGGQTVTVTQVNQAGGDFLVDFLFDTPVCGLAPEVGDLIELVGGVGEVTAPAGAPSQSGQINGMRVKLVTGSAATFMPGPGVFLSPFEPDDGDQAACFVTFSPPPADPPFEGVSPDASVRVRFSEPMDPTAFGAFSTFTVSIPESQDIDELQRNVVGSVESDLGLTNFRFVPSAGMPHTNGTAEEYVFDLLEDVDGITDLAGNALLTELPPISFMLDELAATRDVFGVGLTFSSADQNSDMRPEIRGQFLLDPILGNLKPRPVTRFSAVADNTNLTVGSMLAVTQSIATPLSPLGSHMQTVWRYVDLGFGLLDDGTLNLDLEGMSWAPFAGTASIESYDEYQITVGHSRGAPDEWLNQNILPGFDFSGLNRPYSTNYLDAPKVIHPRERGYTINPINAFTSAAGRILIPWPVNQGIPQSEFSYFTFRDTRVLAVGGPLSPGVPPARLFQLQGVMVPFPYNYIRERIPTIGLPLLMEFNCYPDNTVVGLNGFQVAQALATAPQPFFRVFSTGGVDTSNTVRRVDPDSDTVATGGFSPGLGGAATPPEDNTLYYGQADFVVLVSVVHTAWFDSQLKGTVRWEPAVIEPDPSALPTGTEVSVAFRGALQINDDEMVTGNGTQNAFDASMLDPYGDAHKVWMGLNVMGAGFFPEFLGGTPNWTSDLSDLDGAPLIQARITFVSNPISLLTARIDALGIAATN